jgi:hypothetical protein
MIYILTATHNSKYLKTFFDCVDNQSAREEIIPIIVDASEDGCCDNLWNDHAPVVILRHKGVFWGTSLKILRDYLKKYFVIEEEDTVCLINVDRTFCRDYMKLGAIYAQIGKNLVISHCIDKNNNHVSGGLYADWKKFSFTLSETPNICGTNGLFIKAEDFVKCKISTFLPHHFADFQLVLSLVKGGSVIYEPLNLVLTMEESESIHNPKTWKELFDIRCSCNPVYMAVFVLLCCPMRYKPINLLRCLWWLVKIF